MLWDNTKLASRTSRSGAIVSTAALSNAWRKNGATSRSKEAQRRSGSRWQSAGSLTAFEDELGLREKRGVQSTWLTGLLRTMLLVKIERPAMIAETRITGENRST